MLPLILMFESDFSESAVPGGVGSSIGATDTLLAAGDRRCCLARYEDDLGRSGRGDEDGGVCAFAAPQELRRLELGEVEADAAGDLELGGV